MFYCYLLFMVNCGRVSATGAIRYWKPVGLSPLGQIPLIVYIYLQNGVLPNIPKYLYNEGPIFRVFLENPRHLGPS